MTTRTIAGKEVQINGGGIMIDPNEWDKDVALEIAWEEGLAKLTADHTGNLGVPNIMGVLPGMTAFATKLMHTAHKLSLSKPYFVRIYANI